MEITAYRSRRKLAALLVWCLLLTSAWGLWLWQLDASDLTHDEAISYHWASRPLPEIIANLREAVREHPPTYYALMHWWLALAGPSEFSLRLFTVAAGVVALALMGWVARLSLRSFTGVTSVLPAMMLAVTPGLVYYARVARMYSLVVALSLLSAGIFLHSFLRAKEWPHWAGVVGLALVHLAAITTHYYLVLPILVQPLLLLLARRWKPLLAWCGAQAVPALAALVWFLTSPGLQMTIGSVGPVLEIPAQLQVLRLLGKLVFSPVVQVQFGLLSVLLALVGLGTLVVFLQNRISGTWLLLSLLIPLATAYSMPVAPAARLVLFTLPYVALAIGAVCTLPLQLTRLRHRWLAYGAALGLSGVAAWLLASGGLHQTITHERSRYGRTLETVKAYARPGDAILFYGPWQQYQLEYYDPGGLPPIVALPPSAPPRVRQSEAEPVLHDLMERYDRLWVLPAAVADVDPHFFIGGWLYNSAHAVWDTIDFGLYLPPLPADASADDLRLTFGQTLELQRVLHDPKLVPAGEALRMTLIWNPLRHIERHVQMTLRLVDQNGHTWAVARSIPGGWAAVTDTWAPGRSVIDREGLIVPQGAPPGSYTVRLMASDAASGTPLDVDGEREVDLFTILVTEPVQPPVLHDLPGSNVATFCSSDKSACIVLAGYSPAGTRFQQGYPVPFTLHWLSEGAPAPDIQIRLGVSHISRSNSNSVTPIVTATLPSPWSYADGPPFCQPAKPSAAPPDAAGTSRSPHRVVLPLVLNGNGCLQPAPDRMVTLPAAMMIPPDAPTGPAHVTLEVIGPDGRLWSTTEGETSLPLFELDVDRRPVEKGLPEDLERIQVDFGDGIGLRGYRVEGEATPGGELRVTYAWYARTPPTGIYAVFNHLMAPGEIRVAQADGWPQGGRLLTNQWQAGEYVRDSYTLQIPPDAAPGPYTLYVGLYNAATGERQPAIQDGQLVPDGRVPIPLPGGEDR